MDAVVCNDVWKLYTRSNSVPAQGIVEELRQGLSHLEAKAKYGCHVAVAGVSFALPPGRTFCIMGLSGSGKSTLLRHLNRLIEPSAGIVLVNGEDIGSKSAFELRKLRAESVSMVFQDVALWPHMTVRQNVGYGLEVRGVERSQREQTADRMLDLVKLSGWGDRYSHELSGGMKQRVGLARALATDAGILLLDEPFSALDPIIRDELQLQFQQIIREFNKTAVFITHDLAEAIRLGDVIAIMKDGVFEQIGTAEQVLLNPATEYVRRFVKSVPRIDFVKAAAIMEPLLGRGPAPDPSDLTVLDTTHISEILDLASRSPPFNSIHVKSDSGDVIGQISLGRLLATVRTAV